MTSSNLDILAYEHTPLGPLCLRKRELLSMPGTVVTEVTLNHEFLMSSYYTVSERALSDLALDLHEAPALKVLVGGLGLGYTAHAALASERVSELAVIEVLPEVVGWLRDGLLPLSETLNAEPRFTAEVGDFFERMAAPPEDRFDLILVDIDHAPDHYLDGASAPFYTAEGLEAVKAHLAPGGVLSVWSSADSEVFRRGLEAVFDEVRAEPIPFYNHLISAETTDWIFLAR
ncbi:MAG: spermidine synthase [Gemmatimonadota bacterium]|nr:spermidine synthase [Gemmatimonadota bacterium]